MDQSFQPPPGYVKIITEFGICYSTTLYEYQFLNESNQEMPVIKTQTENMLLRSIEAYTKRISVPSYTSSVDIV